MYYNRSGDTNRREKWSRGKYIDHSIAASAPRHTVKTRRDLSSSSIAQNPPPRKNSPRPGEGNVKKVRVMSLSREKEEGVAATVFAVLCVFITWWARRRESWAIFSRGYYVGVASFLMTVCARALSPSLTTFKVGNELSPRRRRVVVWKNTEKHLSRFREECLTLNFYMAKIKNNNNRLRIHYHLFQF